MISTLYLNLNSPRLRLIPPPPTLSCSINLNIKLIVNGIFGVGRTKTLVRNVRRLDFIFFHPIFVKLRLYGFTESGFISFYISCGAGGCVWSDLIRMGSSDHLQPAVCAALSTHASPSNIHAIHKLGQSEKYYFLLKMQNAYQ